MSQALLLRSSSFSPKKPLKELLRTESYHSENFCAEELLEGSILESTQGLDLEAPLKKFCQEQLPKLSQESSSFFSPVKQPNSQKLEEVENVPPILRPPGLSVFYPQSGFRYFNYGELNLESDFKFNIKGRLETPSPIETDRLMKDPVYLVETLSPTTSSSILVGNQDDYQKILDYLFYSISVISPDRELDRQVLVKGFSDMLINYGFTWRMNLDMLLTILVNYRIDMKILLPKESHIKKYRSSLPLWTRRFESNVDEKEPYSARILLNTLAFIKDLVFRGCFVITIFSELRLIFWWLFLLAQHSELVRNGAVNILVSDMLTFFLGKFPPLDLEQVQKLSVMLTVDFRPLRNSKCTRHWTTAHIPKHIESSGSNHPLNMLHILSLMPKTRQGLEIRGLMSYLCVQHMLGVDVFRVPDRVLMSELWGLVKAHLDKWEMMKPSVTCMKTIIEMFDYVLYSIGVEMGRKSRKAKELRNLLGIVEIFKQELLDLENSENENPEVVILWKVQEVCRRWNFILQRTPAVQSAMENQS